jgi:hypothetical protein
MGQSGIDTKKIFEWALMASLSGTGAFIASYVGRLTDSVDQMNVSVRQLNARIEVMTAELAHTNETLKDHEGRLRTVEKRQSR